MGVVLAAALNMTREDTTQTDAMLAALQRPDAYPHAAPSVRRVETHISWLFLAGDFVYKLKKPVDFGFLDFSTPQQRRRMCEEELRLNRRFSPELYLDVVPITRERDRFAVGGQGEVVEYAVKMKRFPEDATLDRVARRGGLTDELTDAMCDGIAAMHAQAPVAEEADGFGEPQRIGHWFTENFDHIRPLLTDDDDRACLERIARWGEAQFDRVQAVMRGRRRRGFVRECHGDLHLGNLVALEGRVRLFDCIEFNPELRWIDVMSDVAFLYMDLLHEGLTQQANGFLDRYLRLSGDYAGLAVLPYYFVYRALVRAKVAVLRSAQAQDADTAMRNVYRSYLALAERFIARPTPVLMITHGLSGAGKSTLAARLVRRAGALQIRSDVERKRLFGLDELATSGSTVAGGIYTTDASRRTYARLADLAGAALAAGFSVIADATFLDGAQRERFAKLAATAHTGFVILDFQAPASALRARIATRRQDQADASEADLVVLDAQLRHYRPLSDAEQASTLVFDTTDDTAIERTMKKLERRLTP
jgi:aminoglycoside phosphotransferase family enzyme/predicted kinase